MIRDFYDRISVMFDVLELGRRGSGRTERQIVLAVDEFNSPDPDQKMSIFVFSTSMEATRFQRMVSRALNDPNCLPRCVVVSPTDHDRFAKLRGELRRTGGVRLGQRIVFDHEWLRRDLMDVLSSNQRFLENLSNSGGLST